MDYLVYIILALVGFGYFQYNGKKKAETDGKLADTKGQDKQLTKDQVMVQEEIAKLDNAIANLNKNRPKVSDDETDQKKADKWNKD